MKKVFLIKRKIYFIIFFHLPQSLSDSTSLPTHLCSFSPSKKDKISKKKKVKSKQTKIPKQTKKLSLFFVSQLLLGM